jgi:hypothetical protein
MFIVLSNLTKGKAMTVVEQVTEAQTDEQSKRPPENLTRLAAAVEAAYILEAVRK